METHQVVDDDNDEKPGGNGVPSPEPPNFKMNPEVEATMQRGQELRRVAAVAKERLTEVVELLLQEFPDQTTMVANMLDGEAQRVRSIHEQKIRREREARRAKENGHVTNGSSEGGVSNGVPGVPGSKPGPGGGPKGSDGGDRG